MSDLTDRPVMPPDVQEYMDQNGYELYNAQGCWIVVGNETELSPDLFIAIFNRYKNEG